MNPLLLRFQLCLTKNISSTSKWNISCCVLLWINFLPGVAQLVIVAGEGQQQIPLGASQYLSHISTHCLNVSLTDDSAPTGVWSRGGDTPYLHVTYKNNVLCNKALYSAVLYVSIWWQGQRSSQLSMFCNVFVLSSASKCNVMAAVLFHLSRTWQTSLSYKAWSHQMAPNMHLQKYICTTET